MRNLELSTRKVPHQNNLVPFKKELPQPLLALKARPARIHFSALLISRNFRLTDGGGGDYAITNSAKNIRGAEPDVLTPDSHSNFAASILRPSLLQICKGEIVPFSAPHFSRDGENTLGILDEGGGGEGGMAHDFTGIYSAQGAHSNLNVESNLRRIPI